MSDLEPSREHPRVPGPSLWPVGLALGIVVLLVGLVMAWWIVALGVVIVFVFALLWARDVAQEQGLAVLWQREPASAGSLTVGKFPSEWMVVARDLRELGNLPGDARWRQPEVPPTTPLWTDDFSNILSVLSFR